jgi:hypothetical protein
LRKLISVQFELAELEESVEAARQLLVVLGEDGSPTEADARRIPLAAAGVLTIQPASASSTARRTKKIVPTFRRVRRRARSQSRMAPARGR